MKTPWGYEETSLQERIAIHDKYAKYEINDWILTSINLRPGDRVLDIGCGNGKQALLFSDAVGPSGEVVGIDIDRNLLAEAESKKGGRLVRFVVADADVPLPFPDNFFEAVSCCFSIYYYKDISKSLSEMRRVLRRGGKLFIVGPTVENAREMLSIYEEAASTPIDQKREKRMRDEIIPRIKSLFHDVSVEVFENPVIFPDTKTFLDYFSTTLYFKEIVEKDPDAKQKLDILKGLVDIVVKETGHFVVTKRVYGIIGRKR